MFIAKNEQGVCISSQFARANEVYFCLECGQRVIVRRSKTGRPHYAHKAWHRHGGEGRTHKKIKHHLQTIAPQIIFEQKVGPCRADVMYEDEVIEIQVSAIQRRQVQQRQRIYQEKLHWLLGATWQHPERALDCIDQQGKVYRYHPDYCECYTSFHPVTKQYVLVMKRIICWESFFHELKQNRNYCLSYQQFAAAFAHQQKWQQQYSTRYAKVQDDIAQALYRWGIRSEQLPCYVGLPIAVKDGMTSVPTIWQGEYCYRLASGERIAANELSWSQQFYLELLVRLAVCDKKADSYQNYQRGEYTQVQLYQAYRLTWQELPWPV